MEDSVQPSSPVLPSVDTYWNTSQTRSESPSQNEKTKLNAELSRARNVFREQFAVEVRYKEGELELIEERIQLAKILLQRLRLGILAQHYGEAAFCPTTLDYREETIGKQGSWEIFEKEFMNLQSENSGDLKESKNEETKDDGEKEGKDAAVKVSIDEEAANVGQDSAAVKEVNVDVSEEVVASPNSAMKKDLEEDGEEESCIECNGRSMESLTEEMDVDVKDGRREECPRESKEGVEQRVPPYNIITSEGMKCETPRGEEEEESRFYSKKRVIVGNTSQYLDPVAHQHVSADGSTHKWMVYVRGPQAEPDISHFVKAVRFFLHPSYHPNDIVRVKTPPFHLTRHGWGEFPIRVQLEFRDCVNKPVDILHNLVLDRTHTGQQTLGAETVVDLGVVLPVVTESSVHLNGFSNMSRRSEEEEVLMKNIPEVTRPQQTLSSVSTSSLSSLVTSREDSVCATLPKEEMAKDVDDMASVCSSDAESPPPSVEGASQSVGNVITTNLDKCLHTAVRGIPICGKIITSDEFFIPAPSLSQYRSWNIGRRRATEWMRSVAVRKTIQKKLHVQCPLSTRRIMTWCRQNGYTPLDPAPLGGRGFCKICGCQLGEEGDVMEDEDIAERGLDEEEMSRRRKNLEVHEQCHSKLFGPGSYLREGFLDLYEDFQVADFTGEDRSRPQLTVLGKPDVLMERLFTLEQQLRSRERRGDELVDMQELPPSPTCARSRPLVDMIPRFRVPQTPELKWIQKTASTIGIKIYPAVIDRMYAHVVEHMIYISCTRFLRGILGQAIQGAWQGEEGGLSQDRILAPFHLQQAIIKLDHCDFLSNRYLGVSPPLREGVARTDDYESGASSSSCASSDEEGL